MKGLKGLPEFRIEPIRQRGSSSSRYILSADPDNVGEQLNNRRFCFAVLDQSWTLLPSTYFVTLGWQQQQVELNQQLIIASGRVDGAVKFGPPTWTEDTNSFVLLCWSRLEHQRQGPLLSHLGDSSNKPSSINSG